MESDRWRLIESLFQQAVDLPPNKRRDFLIEACGDDVSLRAELQRLVDGSDRADGLIETPPLVDQTSISLQESVRDSIADLRLGSYKVIRKLGRGGMGTVYLAARADQEFQKYVAIIQQPVSVSPIQIRKRLERCEARLRNADGIGDQHKDLKVR